MNSSPHVQAVGSRATPNEANCRLGKAKIRVAPLGRAVYKLHSTERAAGQSRFGPWQWPVLERELDRGIPDDLRPACLLDDDQPAPLRLDMNAPVHCANSPSPSHPLPGVEPCPAPPGPAPRTHSEEELKALKDRAPTSAASMTGVVEKVDLLSDEELSALLFCEVRLNQGWESFADAGLALIQIRDQKLWRGEFPGFEQYYRCRWDFQHSKVYYLIHAATVHASLCQLTDVPKPDCEFQLRPLFGLEPDEARRAWQHAAARSGGRRITGRLVARAVSELKLRPKATPAPRRVNKSAQRQLIRNAIDELLVLAMRKVGHEVLTAKIEALRGQFQILCVPAVKKPRTAETGSEPA